MSIISKAKTTYYIQFRKKDGALTPQRKLFKSSFNGWLHYRWGKAYEIKKTISYADAEIYIAEPYVKPAKKKELPNYIIFVRKDGTHTKSRKVPLWRVRFLSVGDNFLRWGFIPYQCIQKREHNWDSTTYVLERY